MIDDVERVARLTGALASEVRSAVTSAERRSEPDAREVYGVVRGYRLVARRSRIGDRWRLSLEHRPQPWERAPGTGWTG